MVLPITVTRIVCLSGVPCPRNGHSESWFQDGAAQRRVNVWDVSRDDVPKHTKSQRHMPYAPGNLKLLIHVPHTHSTCRRTLHPPLLHVHSLCLPLVPCILASRLRPHALLCSEGTCSAPMEQTKRGGLQERQGLLGERDGGVGDVFFLQPQLARQHRQLSVAWRVLDLQSSATEIEDLDGHFFQFVDPNEIQQLIKDLDGYFYQFKDSNENPNKHLGLLNTIMTNKQAVQYAKIILWM